MKTFFISLLLIISQTTLAKDYVAVKDDFAYAYKIITNEDAAIYKLPLPEKIYDTVIRKDLGDIRVFNKDNIALPHAIRHSEKVENKNIVTLNLDFFPVYSHGKQSAVIEQLDISIANNGSIVEIRTNEQDSNNDNEISGYIIDASQIKHPINELKFEIENDTGFMKTVKLDYSNDLNHWQTLLSKITLAKLDYDSHTLVKDQIKLPSSTAKYYRLSWIDNNPGIAVKNIQAKLNSSRHSRKLQWKTVQGRKSSKDEYTYEYNTGGMFSVHLIDIDFQEKNTLISANIRSRKDEKSNWTSHYSGLFYKLNVNDQVIKNNLISIRPNKHQYWQLVINSKDDFAHAPPEMNFAWSGNELYFLARGEGPYTLAYGNSQAEAPAKPVNTLMNLLNNDEENQFTATAMLGDEMTLRGEEALIIERSIPWQRILLWGILVTAVLILTYMAFRLFKQINQTQS